MEATGNNFLISTFFDKQPFDSYFFLEFNLKDFKLAIKNNPNLLYSRIDNKLTGYENYEGDTLLHYLIRTSKFEHARVLIKEVRKLDFEKQKEIFLARDKNGGIPLDIFENRIDFTADIIIELINFEKELIDQGSTKINNLSEEVLRKINCFIKTINESAVTFKAGKNHHKVTFMPPEWMELMITRPFDSFKKYIYRHPECLMFRAQATSTYYHESSPVKIGDTLLHVAGRLSTPYLGNDSQIELIKKINYLHHLAEAHKTNLLANQFIIARNYGNLTFGQLVKDQEIINLEEKFRRDLDEKILKSSQSTQSTPNSVLGKRPVSQIEQQPKPIDPAKRRQITPVPSMPTGQNPPQAKISELNNNPSISLNLVNIISQTSQEIIFESDDVFSVDQFNQEMDKYEESIKKDTLEKNILDSQKLARKFPNLNMVELSQLIRLKIEFERKGETMLASINRKGSEQYKKDIMAESIETNIQNLKGIIDLSTVFSERLNAAFLPIKGFLEQEIKRKKDESDQTKVLGVNGPTKRTSSQKTVSDLEDFRRRVMASPKSLLHRRTDTFPTQLHIFIKTNKTAYIPILIEGLQKLNAEEQLKFLNFKDPKGKTAIDLLEDYDIGELAKVIKDMYNQLKEKSQILTKPSENLSTQQTQPAEIRQKVYSPSFRRLEEYEQMMMTDEGQGDDELMLKEKEVEKELETSQEEEELCSGSIQFNEGDTLLMKPVSEANKEKIEETAEEGELDAEDELIICEEDSEID